MATGSMGLEVASDAIWQQRNSLTQLDCRGERGERLGECSARPAPGSFLVRLQLQSVVAVVSWTDIFR
jgi:hypothetical protein